MSRLNVEQCPLSLLEKLVSIESVNPVYGGVGEGAVGAFVKDWLDRQGIAFQTQSVEGERENIVARIGNSDIGAVLLEAHMDTVGTGGWFSGSPYDLRKEGRRYYGRGACDTKASLACFMLTLSYYHMNPSELRCPIVFAASVDEESEQKGADKLAELKSELGIEFAITGEPTRSVVVSRHKGVCRYEISTGGKAAHGSTPELGENAIYKMARVCSEIEKYAIALSQREHERAVDRGTLNLGTISGGIGFNVVPDRCKVDVDRRLGLRESPATAFAELKNLVERVSDVKIDCFLERAPLLGDGSGKFVSDILKAAKAVGEKSSTAEVAYMTNAVAYESAGIPAVVFGPGDIAQAHKVDEFIEEGEMERSLAILKRFFAK